MFKDSCAAVEEMSPVKSSIDSNNTNDATEGFCRGISPYCCSSWFFNTHNSLHLNDFVFLHQ